MSNAVRRAGSHNAKLIRLAIEYIDENGGVQDRIPRQEVLRKLIRQHNLRYTHDGSSVPLTPTRYYEIISKYVCNADYRTREKPANGSFVADFFIEGSAVLKPKYLESIGICVKSNREDDADEEVQKAEGESSTMNAKMDRPAVLEDKITSYAGFSTPKSVHTANSGLENVQRELAPPVASPITSPRVEIRMIVKRKHADDDAEQPYTTSKAVHISEAGSPELERSNITIDGHRENEVVINQLQAATSSRSDSGVDAATQAGELSHLVPLGNTAIKGAMAVIQGHINTFAEEILHTSAVAKSALAQLVIEPQAQLEGMYAKMFGAGWRERATKLHLMNDINASLLVQACIAAGLDTFVWGCEPPWPGPRDILNLPTTEHMAQFFSKENGGSSYHNLVWREAQAAVKDQKFQEDKIQPYAAGFARQFFELFSAQLHVLGIPQGCKKRFRNEGVDIDRYWQEREEYLTKIFCKALILKGQIRAAPDYYRLEIPVSGELVDEDMEEVLTSEGKREVRLAITPVVLTRAKLDEQWVLACPGKVYSRPKAE